MSKLRRAEVCFGGRSACAAQSWNLVSEIRNGVRNDTFGPSGGVVSPRVHLAIWRNSSGPCGLNMQTEPPKPMCQQKLSRIPTRLQSVIVTIVTNVTFHRFRECSPIHALLHVTRDRLGRHCR
jgi:hypothetical protein